MTEPGPGVPGGLHVPPERSDFPQHAHQDVGKSPGAFRSLQMGSYLPGVSSDGGLPPALPALSPWVPGLQGTGRGCPVGSCSLQPQGLHGPPQCLIEGLQCQVCDPGRKADPGPQILLLPHPQHVEDRCSPRPCPASRGSSLPGALGLCPHLADPQWRPELPNEETEQNTTTT